MNIVQIFSLPIWEMQFPDFQNQQQQFITTIQDIQEQNPVNHGRDSVAGAWTSPSNVKQVDTFGPVLNHVLHLTAKACFDMQLQVCRPMISSVWFNRFDRAGAAQHEHLHGATFSGAFFIQKTGQGSRLGFRNPCMNPLWFGLDLVQQKNKFNAQQIFIDPREGDIFLWPSHVMHYIEPLHDDSQFISMEFDVICLPPETGGDADGDVGPADQ